MPIKEFHLDRILSEFGMDMPQFIDFCILLGCDYCGSIRGVGRVKAYDLIREHKTIEGVLEHIDKTVSIVYNRTWIRETFSLSDRVSLICF